MTTSRRKFFVGLTGAAAGIACRHTPEQSEQRRAPARASAAAVTPAGTLERPPPARADTKQGALPQRPLGKTGVNVSLLGLGGFHIGGQGDEKDSIALVRRAIDAGITFLDNCWDYHDGQSELRMGKALADGYRERVLLMTKLDGRTRKAATEQLEQSLDRLKTDHIDLVQIHEVIRDSDPQRAFQDDGVVAALIDAKKAGKLRFIGFTGHKAPRIHLAMLKAAEQHGFEFDTVQMPLNVLDAHFHSFEHEVLPELVKRQLGVLGMKSMAAGKIIRAGAANPEECLRYALSLPTSVVISGMDSAEVLERNLKVARDFRPLTDDERASLLARTAPFALGGKLETFKTSHEHDGTLQHPQWLEEARI